MIQSFTYRPHPALRSYIDRYVVNEIPHAFVSSVLPDLSVVMGFQFGGALSLVHSDKTIKLDRLCLTGISERYRQFANSKGFGIVLVYFTPAGASAFFDLPLHQTFKASVPLSDFEKGGDLYETEEKMAAASCHGQRIALIDQFFLKRTKPQRIDPAILCALEHIQMQNGSIRIKQLSEELCMSQSRLEKRFRAAVGCSPKRYAYIIKLRTITRHLQKASSLTQLALQHDYYDQAHFIKDFKRFTGQTPGNFKLG